MKTQVKDALPDLVASAISPACLYMIDEKYFRNEFLFHIQVIIPVTLLKSSNVTTGLEKRLDKAANKENDQSLLCLEIRSPPCQWKY